MYLRQREEVDGCLSADRIVGSYSYISETKVRSLPLLVPLRLKRSVGDGVWRSLGGKRVDSFRSETETYLGSDGRCAVSGGGSSDEWTSEWKGDGGWIVGGMKFRRCGSVIGYGYEEQ